MANNRFPRQRKIIAGTILGTIIVVFTSFVLYGGMKARGLVKEYIASEFLAGEFDFGEVSGVFSGDVVIRDILWKDPEGNPVVKIPRAKAYVRLRDILFGNFGANSLRRVELSEPEIYLKYDEKDGLNIFRLLKTSTPAPASGEKKSSPSENGQKQKAAKYQTTLEIDNGFTLINNQRININGEIVFSDEKEDLNLKIDSNKIKIDALLPGLGIYDELLFTIDAKGTLDKPQAEGEISMPKLNAAQLALTNLKGHFAFSDGNIKVSDASANVYGGSVKGGGNIRWADRSFEFDAAGSGINSGELSDSLDAPVSFNAHISGTSDFNSLVASGPFAVGAGQAKGVPFTSITGNFYKRGGNMTFSNLNVSTAVGNLKIKRVFVNENNKISVDFSNLLDDANAALKKQADAATRKGINKTLDSIKKGLKF
ncbi:MAG: AsmA-like C-terminal region-containing protein [Acidaminococcales bacterium]|jgi:hypothetical protein|nr:AsmA-like C-terminal region-containing protein [Acidaminococcales bacterium]